MPTPLDTQWWDEEEAALYEALLPLVLAALWAGMEGGTEALPANMQNLVNVNHLNQAAIDFAKEYRYTFIRDITETTKTQVQDIMANWIASGQSMDVLEAQLATIFGESRASRIAATETTRAFSQGNMDAWESTGFVSSGEWMTAQDERVCPICASHEGEHVGIGDIDAAPPNSSHPGCRCWLQPVVDEALFEQRLNEILGL